MIDYDEEARNYDASRGGEPRARAAAGAVERLLPPEPCSVLDVACGTGIVTRRLVSSGRTVVGVDRSAGMLSVAGQRIAGGVVRADATQLPFASDRFDAVVLVWLLHLPPDPAPVLAEAARVLRPGGVLITTVDKDEASFAEECDIAEATAELRRQYAPRVPDRCARVREWAAERGMAVAGGTEFRGTGQSRGPRRWREVIAAGHVSWASHASTAQVADVCRRLSELPDQDTPRSDPLYRLVALKA